ncbi:MAG: YceI family protein [Bacteroidales bacterium]
MKKRYIFTLILSIAISGLIQAQEASWSMDNDHSMIQFKTNYMGITEVTGQFSEYIVTVIQEDENFENANIEVTIQSSSIDTDNDRRDEHLRSEDFIYAEQYPEITFKSTSFVNTGGDNYKLTGDLTIRGISRVEEFDVVYNGMIEQEDMTRAAFKLTGSIDRYDYDVDWNRSFTKGLVVSKEIEIICDVLLVK